jgi:hypothetical protein
MSKAVSRLVLVLAAVTALALSAGTGAAHATAYSPDGKIRFTYGHLDEPVYTFQKTGLDLILRDNATGASLPGYEYPSGGGPAKLTVKYRYGGPGGPELNITEEFRGQHGNPGRYTYPIMFTQPGSYYLLVSGVINGTLYSMELAPAHEIESIDAIMWPQVYGTNADLQREIDALKAEVASLKNGGATAEGNAPGVGGLLTLGLLGLALVAFHRARRH